MSGAGDLLFVKDVGGDLRARCKNSFCRLEELFAVVLSDKMAEVRFSPMFSSFNLLFMGSDALEERLEKLVEQVVGFLSGGKTLKTRISSKWR